jgi:hypothetical protein
MPMRAAASLFCGACMCHGGGAISSAIALRPFCAHGGGLGPVSGTGTGTGRGGGGTGGGLLPHRTEVQPSPPPPPAARHPAPRAPPPHPQHAPRLHCLPRWNTYYARPSPPPNCTAPAPTSRPSTSAESECTHRSASSRDGASTGSPVNAFDACAAHHTSTAWRSRTRGAQCSGQCRYMCIVVSAAPAQEPAVRSACRAHPN